MELNENLVNRIREAMVCFPNASEKNMLGGVCFMVNEKVCMGVFKDEMMCRIDPTMEETVLEIYVCRPMDFTGKSMKGFVFVSEDAIQTKKKFDYWIKLCLEFNPKAKASKKKKE